MNKIDSQHMYKVYDNWPEIIEKVLDVDIRKIECSEIDHIVFAGMGGSGALGDIFSSILSKSNIHVSVIKGYLLPKTVDKNTLVVTTSVSGNTVETLNVLKSAEKTNCKLIAFSSGGKMIELCKKYKIEYRKISQCHSPRASFAGFLFSMLKVLEPIIPIGNFDINEALNEIKKLHNKINSGNLNEDNPSLKLAMWLQEIPLIYYPWGLQSAAIRFKNSLQENTKLHAMSEDIVEACHNGIVSWEKKSKVQPIFIRGKDDYIRTKERWNILEEYFTEKQIEYKIVDSVDGNVLSKLSHLIYLLDYASIYKAILTKIDPSPISSIDFIKKRL